VRHKRRQTLAGVWYRDNAKIRVSTQALEALLSLDYNPIEERIDSALDLHTSHERLRASYGSPDDSSQPVTPFAERSRGIVVAACGHFDPPADSRARTTAGEAANALDSYPLVVIVGPTASGKSALAIRFAECLDGEIVNYDSIQVYRGLDIGSGKVSEKERHRIPHHLLDILEPNQLMTAGRYRHFALEVLTEIRERGKLPILVGGTGLYLRALLEGLFEGPARSEDLRARLRAIRDRRGRIFLHRLLARRDPAAAQRIHPHDANKVIRALEVCFATGDPITAWHDRGRKALAGFHPFKLGLLPDRAELYRRIDRRVESMFAAGLIEETRVALVRQGNLPSGCSDPLDALGYRQARAVLRGEMRLSDAICAAQAATRHYAKRQITWFRREPDVAWLAGFGDDAGIQLQAFDWLFRKLPQASQATRPPGDRNNFVKGLNHEYSGK
jgi:tRNA dimethylallyltransferase